MAKKVLYRTKINVEVLSEEPLEVSSLADVAYEIENGESSGTWDVTESKRLIGKKAANAVINQGSDPEFFQMDSDGNELL